MVIYRLNSNYLLYPLNELTVADTESVSSDLCEEVGNQLTWDLLDERYLHGVRARHERLDLSDEACFEARALTEKGELTAYAIRNIMDARWIGMGVVMPNLRLRQPILPAFGMLRTAITRRSRLLSREIRPGEGDPSFGSGPNLAAWVGAGYDDGVLGDTYKALNELSEGQGWTVEPLRVWRICSELRAVGMLAIGRAMRLDDARSPIKPPLLQLYQFAANA